MSLDKVRRGPLADSAPHYLISYSASNAHSILKDWIPPKTAKRLEDACENYKDKYSIKLLPEEWIRPYNNQDKRSDKADPAGDEMAEKIAKEYSTLLKEFINNLDEDGKKFLPMLNASLTVLNTSGSLLETNYNSQYMNQLTGRLTTIPSFKKVGFKNCKEGLEDLDPETKEERGPLSALNDLYQGINDLILVDFERQRCTEKGWTNKDEKAYLEKLKDAQLRTINAYDRLYAIKNPEKYDKYLNDPLDTITGKSINYNRDIHDDIGAIRGQAQAIENGWQRGELEILGTLGMMEAHGKKVEIKFNEQLADSRKTIENYKRKTNPTEAETLSYNEASEFLKNEEKSRKLIDDYNKDVQAVKDSYWTKKVTTAEEKHEISKAIRTLATKHQRDAIPGYKPGDLNDLGTSTKRFLGILDKKALENNRNFFKSLDIVMNDGNANVHRGTKQYNDIIKDVDKLAKLTHDSINVKDALKTDEGKKLYVKLMDDLDVYLTRKDGEIAKAENKGKKPNANSVMRRNIMKRVKDVINQSFGNPSLEELRKEPENIINEPEVKVYDPYAYKPGDSDALRGLKNQASMNEQGRLEMSKIHHESGEAFADLVTSTSFKSLYLNVLVDTFANPGDKKYTDNDINEAVGKDFEKNFTTFKNSLGEDFCTTFERNLLDANKEKVVSTEGLTECVNKSIRDLYDKYSKENNIDGLKAAERTAKILGSPETLKKNNINVDDPAEGKNLDTADNNEVKLKTEGGKKQKVK